MLSRRRCVKTGCVTLARQGGERGGCESMRRTGLRPIFMLSAVALFTLFALTEPGVVRAQTLGIAEAETLVRASYFEGLPEEVAARIGRAGAERLIEMLFDPEEGRSHGQILLALGLCGAPDSLAAMLAWRKAFDRVATLGTGGRTGEIDRDHFKAWQAFPYALGHLARFDPRAVVELENLMTAAAPSWSFRHHEGARLYDLARRSAATSLALTGLPEAGQALDRAGRELSDVRFEAHLREARALYARRAK